MSLNYGHQLFISHTIYKYGELEWNDIDRETQKTMIKTCPNAIWADLGANPGLCGERPATNHLSHGTKNRCLNDVCAFSVTHPASLSTTKAALINAN
jgi:hypothetical protein